MTALPASRQRGARRESTSSTAPGGSARVRKNSIANNASGTTGNGSMRPRANTISHVDNTTLGLLAAANSSVSGHEGVGLDMGSYSGMGGLPGVANYHSRGMSSAARHHGKPHVLPKLETKNHNINVSASLRTAPAFGGFGGEMDMESFWMGNTVNPAELHFSDSPHMGTFDPQSPYHQGFAGVRQGHATMDGDGNFGWLNTFENQMTFNNFNEQAIDGSSPSAISTSSPGAMSEVMLDGSNNPLSSSGPWQNGTMSQASFAPPYSMDLPGPTFLEMYPPSQLSPKSLSAQMVNTDQYFATPTPLTSQTPLSMLPGMGTQYFHPSMTTKPETPSNSAASISSSNRQSSVTSASTDSITDATRQALLATLSQPSMYGSFKITQPQASSPLSPGFPKKPRRMSNVPLPSTYDLQRYVAAYIQYFHPHLPFLHIPSLNFDSPAFTSNLRASSGHFAYGHSAIAGGGGSLILAMAAIGALYEYDFTASKELFEMAKKMIQLYLEERRKADMSAALKGNHVATEASVHNTPLWLVQAMLLNVIYGHNSGDKTLAGIASTHCAALINLSRAAGLVKPLPEYLSGHEAFQRLKQEDTPMGGDEMRASQWNGAGSYNILDAQNQWYHWRLGEERKRTLYAVFILSSLCVSAYNHAPALMNSEIGLDLPCDESLWAVDSAEGWRSLGSFVIAEQRSISFASALSSLLTASQRPQQRQYHNSQPFDEANLKFENLPESDIKPSTFGCLVLINALHNYIWETRQRHMGRQWTTQETEAMHAHVEPALRAWQAAWSSHPEHSVERPNPFGASCLSADCIPYLDLAYVRLFVNLGRSKEAFFKRDFGAMADELARGAEIIQHADHSPSSSPSGGSSVAATSTTGSSPGIDTTQIKLENATTADFNPEQPSSSGQCSKRERHLRKAAFCAVNALIVSDKLGVTFADFSSRELPLQSALCAFDCAQVVAEWVSTVQQRVGRYLGILGRDVLDYTAVPAIMLLEEDDCRLLEKINDVLASAEMKLAESGTMDMAPMSTQNCPGMDDGGFGSKILLLHARLFDRASVWPSKFHLTPLSRMSAKTK